MFEIRYVSCHSFFYFHFWIAGYISARRLFSFANFCWGISVFFGRKTKSSRLEGPPPRSRALRAPRVLYSIFSHSFAFSYFFDIFPCCYMFRIDCFTPSSQNRCGSHLKILIQAHCPLMFLHCYILQCSCTLYNGKWCYYGFSLLPPPLMGFP